MKKKLVKHRPILREGITINPALDNNNYADQPFFKAKLDKANEILRTVGLPKGLVM